ncbi:MAG: class I SAM-dependent methyltransferase, partial [Promethearchaeota archaeon]
PNLNDNKGQDYLEHTIIELINNFAKSFKYTELKLELNSLFSSFSQEMTIIDLIVIPASAIPEKYVRKTPKYTNLKDYLRSLKIPEIILKEIPTSFDVVGNIAIMEINRNDKLDNTIREFLNSRTNNGPKNMKYKIKVDGKEYDLNTENIKMLIGRGIMSLFRNIKTVVNKKSSIKGEFRLREFEHIAGIKNYHTLHKENGLTFELDLSEAFFSPRLVYERKRVSTLPYREGSIILDAFAGVGPFSLQILSNYPVNVYSIEKNPMAYKYLIKNIKHNIRKLKGEILTYNGDFRDFKDDKLGKGIRNRADCIIMNLPERNLEFINELPYYIKKQDNVGKESNNKENNNAENINYNDYLGEGYTLLIIYLIVPNSDPYNTALSLLKDKFEENHIRIKKILNQRIVKNYSPLLDIIVLDVLIYV